LNQTSKLKVSQIVRDRFARATKTSLEGKEILTPNFSPLIQSSNELDIYLRRMLSLEDNQHLGTFVMRIFDANNLLLPMINIKNLKRLDIETKSVPTLYRDFFEKTISFIDPATEYLDFEFHFDKFIKLADKVHFPRQVMAYLHLKDRRKKNCSSIEYKRWKGQVHRKFWYDLDRERRRLNDLITEYFDLEATFETKILIPPMPLVDNEGLLDIAVRINDMSKALAVDRVDSGECATYFLLSKSSLRDKKMLEKIVEYMKHDPATLTIFKFKNLTLWASGIFTEREAFRDLMKDISEIKKDKPEKLFMLLEGSFQCFPSASYGFDLVSSSLRLLDIDSAYGENAGYGGYFYEDKLWNAKYTDLPEIMSNNDGKLPCSCHICRSITYDSVKEKLQYDGKKLTSEEWNSYRREHNLFVMNRLMKMINTAINEKQIELVRQRIKDSEISNLKTLIPQHYESD
jgi:hypothetical protein